MQNILAIVPERLQGVPFWSESSLPVGPILAIVGTILLGVGAWGLWKIGGRVWRRSEGLRLFSRIAAERGLSVGERWELWRLSRRQGLSTPLTLLVCEATLSAHVSRESGRLGQAGAQEFGQRMSVVKRRLFGE